MVCANIIILNKGVFSRFCAENKYVNQTKMGICFSLNQGPFWICATLVFAVAISGNLSKFFIHLGKRDFRYVPDFRKGS